MTVLQQCCDYHGTGIDRKKVAGRTFPVANATIGAAYTTQRIVRSKHGVQHDELDQEMKRRKLNEASREMAQDVVSVAAVPFLHDHSEDQDAALGSQVDARKRTVVAVLYLDTDEAGFFGNPRLWEGLIQMCNGFVETISGQQPTVAGRIANTAFWTGRAGTAPAVGDAPPLSAPSTTVLEQLLDLEPPCAPRLGYMRYDFSDLVPIVEAHP